MKKKPIVYSLLAAAILTTLIAGKLTALGLMLLACAWIASKVEDNWRK